MFAPIPKAPINIAKAKRTRRTDPLEATIEAAVCKYAEERGFLQDKFSSPGKRSVPDRVFWWWDHKSFFIEFKRKGAKPTPAQLRDHQRRRDHGHEVYVVDNVEQGKQVIELWLASNR